MKNRSLNVFAHSVKGRGKTPIKQGNNFSFNGDDPIDFEDADSTLHFFFPKDYAYAAADSVTDFSNRVSLRRYIYSDRGKDYMLVGVPWGWMNAAPAGTLIIDPTTMVTNSDDEFEILRSRQLQRAVHGSILRPTSLVTEERRNGDLGTGAPVVS